MIFDHMMKRLTVLALLAALCGFVRGADVPGAVGNMIIPMATGRDDADSSWRHLSALIEHVPAYNMATPFPGRTESVRGYFLWQEISNRLLRETGLEFYRRFPDDPRIWTWFAATRQRTPRYWNIAEAWRLQGNATAPLVFDKAAQEEWRATSADLSERVIRDTAAPVDLRLDVWTERIDGPLSRYAIAVRSNPQAPMPDFERLGADLMGLGEALPDVEDDRLRNTANYLLRALERYLPEIAATWRTRLAKNPNRSIADVAIGQDAIEEARVTPIEMRFTAIDGRQVDLRELRGKVVLLDFRGVTWCGACRMEEPYMRDAYAKYREHGFEIVTITYETKESSRDFVLRYTQENGLVWPHYFDGKGAQNPYIKRFGITAVPQHFLLDQKGLLVSTDVRGKKLEPEVKRLLQL